MRWFVLLVLAWLILPVWPSQAAEKLPSCEKSLADTQASMEELGIEYVGKTEIPGGVMHGWTMEGLTLMLAFLESPAEGSDLLHPRGQCVDKKRRILHEYRAVLKHEKA